MPPVRTQAQINAEAIAPGRQPTEPYNGWSKLPVNTQNLLTSKRNYTKEIFNSAAHAKTREAVARYPLNDSSFSNKLIDKSIPMVGASAPPQQLGANQINATNVGSFAGSLMGTTSGGLAGLPITAMSGQTVKPVKGGASIDLNKGTVTPTAATKPTMGKQGEAMDDKQMFKVAFLAKCIDEGLNLDEIKTRVKQALYFAEKRALDGPITNILGQLGSIPLVGLAGLTAAGAGGYYLGNQVVGPGLHKVTKAPVPSREEMLNEELTNEYDRQATLIKRQTEMAKRRRERDRGISGVTRY